MTEREIPAGAGFPFGGMTDPFPVSAPPVSSEPRNPAAAPVYSSRREARAAAAAASAPAYDGIASLFPLLGDAPLPPLVDARPQPTESLTDLGATQAIPAAEVAAELATPVAPYVVPQSAPVAIVPAWHTPETTAAAFPVAASAASHDADASAVRHGHAAVPMQPSRPKQSARGRDHDRRAARPAPHRGSRATVHASGPTNHSFDDRKPLRQRIFGVGVMVAVGGLFAVLAIPAYADNGGAALTAASAVQTQKVDVANAAASTITTTARDGYTATSAADLKAMYAEAMREQNIADYLKSGAKAKGDDYPWYAELDRAQGGGLSPLGYYYRECVDFVAWRLNRDAGTTSAPFKWTWSKLTPNGGDGHEWKAAWLAHGWPTGTTPVPGSVAWFGNNHVGYVNGILDNGQVLIEEYNYTPHAYSTRVINPSQAYYLYAPPANG